MELIQRLARWSRTRLGGASGAPEEDTRAAGFGDRVALGLPTLRRNAPGVPHPEHSGRLSIYWALPGFLPVPHHWTSRLTDGGDGTLIRNSEVSAPQTGAFEDYTSQDLVVQGRYFHAASDLDPISALADLASLLEMPHAEVTAVPDWGENSTLAMILPEEIAKAASGDGPESSASPSSVDAERLRDSEGEPEVDPEGAPEEWQPLLHRTFVHLVVALPEPQSPEELEAAVAEAVELVHSTYRAIHATTGVGLQLPVPETHHMHMLVGMDRVAVHGGEGDTVQGPFDGTDDRTGLEALWGLGMYSPRIAYLAESRVVSEENLPTLVRAEIEASQHTPRSLVFDLRNQAVAAARVTGDPRTAVVMAAATCESWADLLLGALLWEEGCTPEEAVDVLSAKREAKPRLLQLLGPRLKGSWDVGLVPALAAWDRHVRLARNRVVHTGGLPSLRLAERSLDAMFGFIGLTVDRLCEAPVRSRYPMATLLIANRVSIEARGGWTRRMRSAADEADALSLNGVFDRWYTVVTNLQLMDHMRPEPDHEARVELVRLVDGRDYWVQHDWDSKMARLVETIGEAAEFAKSQTAPADEVSTSYSFDQCFEFVPVGEWVPEHRLWPRVALMRDPNLWDIPPDAPAGGT